MDIRINFSDNYLLGGPTCDLVIENGDLSHDSTLLTPVIISLFTDRLAAADDELPDGSRDRRGWWGDLPLDSNNTGAINDRIGSKIWLLSRSKQTTDTLTRAIGYARAALQWMIEDKIVDRIDVSASWGTTGNVIGQLLLSINIIQHGITGAPINTKYQLLLDATFSAISVVSPVIAPQSA